MKEKLKNYGDNLNIQYFLNYIKEKGIGTTTDKIVYVFCIEKPELYQRAQKEIYPDKFSQPGNEAFDRLRKFIDANFYEFKTHVGFLDRKEIEYDVIFQALFL